MNTQLKVGDKVKVIKAVGFDFLTNCNATIFVIDNSDYTIKVVPDNDPNGYWVDAASFEYEILPPAPKWLPIDKDNLPKCIVAATQVGSGKVHAGRLYNDDDYMYLEVDEITELKGLTHYIPLTDLLNLPISE